MTQLLSTRRRAWIAYLSSYMMFVVTPCIAQQVQTEHPNLLVDASARFVAAGMAQSLDYTQPLNDFILGATVTGQGHTTGTMDAELVADPHRAAVRLLVQGRTEMDTVARCWTLAWAILTDRDVPDELPEPYLKERAKYGATGAGQMTLRDPEQDPVPDQTLAERHLEETIKYLQNEGVI